MVGDTTPEEEDDVTEPGIPSDVPEADALEQQLAARPGEAGTPAEPVGDREVDEADLLEQDAVVPIDEDDDRS